MKRFSLTEKEEGRLLRTCSLRMGMCNTLLTEDVILVNSYDVIAGYKYCKHYAFSESLPSSIV